MFWLSSKTNFMTATLNEFSTQLQQFSLFSSKFSEKCLKIASKFLPLNTLNFVQVSVECNNQREESFQPGRDGQEIRFEDCQPQKKRLISRDHLGGGNEVMIVQGDPK